MARSKKMRSEKTGLPPGTLIHIGEKKVEYVKITIIDYDEQNFEERQVSKIEECFPFKTTPTITWINIDGIHRIDIIERIGREFDLHPLILEDILNTNQRPKQQDFENCLFIVLKMLTYNDQKQSTDAEQVSLVIGRNFVLSFQESIGDVFDYIRERIRNGKGRVRKMSSDYLAYSLIDAVVDNYFLILEKLGENIESLEEELVENPSEHTIRQIHSLKRELIFLRKSVWPLREVINGLQKSESSLIKESTRIYLRDVYDHTIQIIDAIESLRDIVTGMVDIYLSSISNRLNAIMKVLTMIATIFIPLTFVVGIYGMNFRYMPELQWRWAYPAVWLIMLAIAITMLIYFKKKKWL